MDQHWPNEIEIVRGIAVVHCMLANEEDMSPAWDRVSNLEGLPRWQAVEASALSQIYIENEPSGNLDIVARESAIKDLDRVFELVESNSRFVVTAPPEQDPFEEQGPPPRHAFYLLDRDQIEPSDNLSPHDIPVVVGEALLYGRQTDRDARLVVLATKNDKYDACVEVLTQTLADELSGDSKEEPISSTSVAADCLT